MTGAICHWQLGQTSPAITAVDGGRRGTSQWNPTAGLPAEAVQRQLRILGQANNWKK